MMAIKKSPLGKGLESLLPESFEGGKKDFFQCSIEEIQKNPFQPRKEFDPSALAELSESIREHGIIQPLIVRNNENGGGYLLVAGERRLRAAIQVGLKKVPVVVRNSIDNQKLLEEALIENIQREDLNPVDEALAYRRLIDEFTLTQETVAKKVGKNRSSIANSIRLLQLPEYILSDIGSGLLSAGHARVLLGFLDRPADMKKLRNDIIKKQMSVREAEKEGKTRIDHAPAKKRTATSNRKPGLNESYCRTMAGTIEQALGSKVNIRQNGKQGTIEISYYSLEDLERIMDRLSNA